ncbi:MAG TPA: hypothetical protein VJZ27_09865 [Aggregatilineales bacterium]|nr:hypothetical protein [Aggregatilineales bacterium]
MVKNKKTSTGQPTADQDYTPFEPSPSLAAQLSVNRAGKLTGRQKNSMRVAAFGSSCGLLVIAVLVINVLVALLSGISAGGVVGVIFFVFFVLSFAYLAGTLYFNARMFVPDVFGKKPVRQSHGRLKIRMAGRDRPELPFSYIIGDYSFAPYVVPIEVPMEKDREYIVYYAASSRMFLNIEPVNDNRAAK